MLRIKPGPVNSRVDDPLCPHWRQVCIRGKCAAWHQIAGQHPQTAQPITQWGCTVFQWAPLLQMDHTKQTARVAESVVSMRNETASRLDIVAKSSMVSTRALAQLASEHTDHPRPAPPATYPPPALGQHVACCEPYVDTP